MNKKFLFINYLWIILFSLSCNLAKDTDQSLLTDGLKKWVFGDKSSSVETTTTAFSSDFVQKSYVIDGKVEKGPFVKNSQITITELDNSLSKTNRVFRTTTKNDLGEFSFPISLSSTKILVEGVGKYYNEISSTKTTTSFSTLKTIVDLSKVEGSSVTVNLNVLTTLQTDRLKKLVGVGKMDFDKSNTISKKEVLNIFSLDVSKIDKLYSAEICSEPELLRISSILQGRLDGKGNQELIEKISKELAENGKITNNSLIAQLQNQEREIKDNVKYSKVLSNLKKVNAACNVDISSLTGSIVDPAGGATDVGKVVPPDVAGNEEMTDVDRLKSFTVNDIKKWDGLSADNSKLPSEVSDPNFTIPSSYKGLENFKVELIADSIQKTDNTGIYEYKVKVYTGNRSFSRGFTIDYIGFRTVSNLLNSFDVADIKQWDGLRVDNTKLPSQTANPGFNPPNRYKGLSNFKVKLIGGIQRDDAAGTYVYRVRILNSDESASRDIRISYSGFLTSAENIESLVASDIKQWDGLSVDNSKLPSTVSDPTFTAVPSTYKSLKNFTVTLVTGSVRKTDNTGAYVYEVKVENSKKTLSKNINISYSGFQTTEENIVLTVLKASDIKQWDGLSVDNSKLPSTVSDPTFTTVPNTYKGLTNFTVVLVAGSVRKTDNTGAYDYQATVSNAGNTVSKTFSISYVGFQTFQGLVNLFIESDIKRWDGLTEDSTKLPSAIGSPDFSTGVPNTYKGLTNFGVSLVAGSVTKTDLTGNYEYKAKVSHNTDVGISKELTVTYNAFLSSGDDIRSLSAADIKKWDGLNPTNADLPSSLDDPNFTVPNSYNGLSSFTVSLNGGSVTKTDATGVYEYQVTVTNSSGSLSRQLTVSYNNLKKTMDILNTFTVADIKSFDDITVDNTKLPNAISTPVFPVFSNIPKVGGKTSYKGLVGFTVIFKTETLVKDDASGTYRYEARVTSADNVSKDFTVVYTGWLSSEQANLNKFTSADIKNWDGVTPSGKLPSAMNDPDFSTGVPNTHKGLTNFKVELVAGSKTTDDKTGSYSYQAKVTTAVNKLSKTFMVSYTIATVTDLLNKFTVADIKSFDHIDVSNSIYPSNVRKPLFVYIPKKNSKTSHKGLVGFTVTLKADSIVRADWEGSYQYDAVVKDSTGTVSKTFRVKYTGWKIHSTDVSGLSIQGIWYTTAANPKASYFLSSPIYLKITGLDNLNISEHASSGSCSKIVNKLLISYDGFKNCEPLYHKKINKNWLIIPRRKWKPNTTYKVGIRQSNKQISLLNENSKAFTFTTLASNKKVDNLFFIDDVSVRNFVNSKIYGADNSVFFFLRFKVTRKNYVDLLKTRKLDCPYALSYKSFKNKRPFRLNRSQFNQQTYLKKYIKKVVGRGGGLGIGAEKGSPINGAYEMYNILNGQFKWNAFVNQTRDYAVCNIPISDR